MILTQNVKNFEDIFGLIGPFQWKTLFQKWQFKFGDVIYKVKHENRTRYKFTTFCVECQTVQKCDFDAKCCKFLKTYFALFVLFNERYYYKKDSSSSLVSFASQSFIGKDKRGKICLSKFTTFCVDITFIENLTNNAKCCKLLMGSVFEVWLANDIVEFEQSFFCINIFHCLLSSAVGSYYIFSHNFVPSYMKD